MTSDWETAGVGFACFFKYNQRRCESSYARRKNRNKANRWGEPKCTSSAVWHVVVFIIPNTVLGILRLQPPALHKHTISCPVCEFFFPNTELTKCPRCLDVALQGNWQHLPGDPTRICAYLHCCGASFKDCQEVQVYRNPLHTHIVVNHRPLTQRRLTFNTTVHYPID